MKTVLFYLSVVVAVLIIFAFFEKRSVVVNYDLSFKEMIAAGRYDLVDHRIDDSFSQTKGAGKIKVDFAVINFGRNITYDSALIGLDKRGLRPATLPELLAFGAKYHNDQLHHEIIALGSVKMITGADLYDSEQYDHSSSRRYLVVATLGWAYSSEARYTLSMHSQGYPPPDCRILESRLIDRDHQDYGWDESIFRFLAVPK